jgi:hypothetical protein
MCLKACANYLGQDVDYASIMAASGAAFRLTWNTEFWDGGNVDAVFTFDDPSKVFRLGIETLGYKYNLISRSRRTKKTEFHDFIRSKIDAGIPVIACGIIGPPEACIVTGYRDGGDTLLGWNFFQDNSEFAGNVTFDASGYFITDQWWENPDTTAVMSLGEVSKERFTTKTILENAIEVMTGREHKTFAKGIAAYDAWAKAISKDSEFPENAVLPILAERLMCHGDAMDCLADGRYNAAAYLKSLLPSYPTYQEQLKEAAALFEKVSGTASRMAKILGGWQRGENEMRTFAKSEVRKQLAEIIFIAKNADQKALAILRELVTAF